ncbi:MAG: hypothetical protein GY787_29360 [Alteromonadales bacterium]|nr:hypothetical protein [Alteromonadales bacterium]
MNQAILFNDDLTFDKAHGAWRISAQYSGLLLFIYFHSEMLSQKSKLDSATKFDLEEQAESWLERNDITEQSIHLNIS